MQQNARTTSPPKTVEPYKKWAFEQYITFCATGGLVVSDTGEIKTVKIGEFCQQIGIDEKTTWRWKTQTPDFALRVRQRRYEIMPVARETKVFNHLFLL